MEKRVFTTVQGVEIPIRPVSPTLVAKIAPTVLREFGVEGPPTYTVEIVGGGTQEFPHDETTLDVPGDPDATAENRAEWDEYVDTVDAANREANKRFLRLLYLKGVDIELPEDETWIEDQEFLGFEVPEDPRDRKIHYIQTELLTTIHDSNRLIAELMGLNQIAEEVESAEDSFRGGVEGETDQGDGEETPGR